MKTAIIYIFTLTLSLLMLQACGQEDAEIEPDQQAVQDSLEQAYEAEIEQMRQDSIARAEADSIEAEEEERREQANQIEYDEDGDFVVQIEAWRSEVKAQQQAEEWKERGYDQSFVVTYGDEDTGDVWYRVRIGQFDTREMAERLSSKLEEEHDTRSWVSRADGPVQQEAMND